MIRRGRLACLGDNVLSGRNGFLRFLLLHPGRRRPGLFNESRGLGVRLGHYLLPLGFGFGQLGLDLFQDHPLGFRRVAFQPVFHELQVVQDQVGEPVAVHEDGIGRERRVAVGREERVNLLTAEGMQISPTQAHISTLGLAFVEVVLAPRSGAEGRTIKELDIRGRYGFTAIALLRKGRSYRTNVADFSLEMGDSLLMVGEPDNLKRLRSNPGFIILEPSLGDQPLQRRQAFLSVGVVFAAIAASILGIPVYLAMLAGAILIILFGLLTMEEATRAVEWQAIFLIAGMYSVSLAMVHTGLAALMGSAMLSVVTPLGPLGLAAGAYLLTALLTQVMGGQVSALVTGPVAISTAIVLHTNPQAIAVATAIGCSASFFTPIAHPVNILMIGPANYTFKDFFKIGWGLTLVCFVMLLVGMALFWKL